MTALGRTDSSISIGPTRPLRPTCAAEYAPVTADVGRRMLPRSRSVIRAITLLPDRSKRENSKKPRISPGFFLNSAQADG